jgi:Fe-S-cluster containining protein
VFHVYLTAEEARTGHRQDWTPELPYALERRPDGTCAFLSRGDCSCDKYHDRPKTCHQYSCREDRRIWADFERMTLQPEVQKRLDEQDRAAGLGTSSSAQPTESLIPAD